MRDFVLPDRGSSIETILNEYPQTVLIHSVPTDRGWRRFFKFENVFPVRQEFFRFSVIPGGAQSG